MGFSRSRLRFERQVRQRLGSRCYLDLPHLSSFLPGDGSNNNENNDDLSSNVNYINTKTSFSLRVRSEEKM